MKKHSKRSLIQYYGVLILLLITPFMTLIAQSDVKINSEDVSSWFQRNWMWVAGAVLLLIIIAVAGSGKRRSRTTTTIVKDDLGNVKRVTTTEVKE
ncbi:MAG: hypothetical protein QM764_05850 [Chitinophagaceae bacterium]